MCASNAQGKYGCGIMFYMLTAFVRNSLTEAQVCSITGKLLSENILSPKAYMYQIKPLPSIGNAGQMF
jgi:hypothetical protein